MIFYAHFCGRPELTEFTLETIALVMNEHNMLFYTRLPSGFEITFLAGIRRKSMESIDMRL